MRILIFSVLSRYGLACKYRIISQISICDRCRIGFLDISGIAFSYFLDQITTHLLPQVKRFDELS